MTDNRQKSPAYAFTVILYPLKAVWALFPPGHIQANLFFVPYQYLTVFLLSAHQSSSQSNILITALPLMLLRSRTNSLMMCAVQHQLPPSERSLKLTCLQKHIPIASPVTLCLLVMTLLCPWINVNCLALCSVAP